MNFRKNLYFVVDFLFNGSAIRKHLKDIGNHYYNADSEANSNQIQKRISNIIDYAIANVPFYSDLNLKDLADFPVVNKAIIKSDYTKFISKEFDINKLPYVTTSGSTGTPFKSYRDSNKTLRHQADNIFFNGLAGAEVGDKLYYFRVWNKINRKGGLKKVLQNIVELDANEFSQLYVEEILSQLAKDKSKKYLLSYASSYEAFVNTIKSMDNLRPDTDISCIISMSETLPEGIKNYLQEYFNTSVISRYSNMENGFIAQQCVENSDEYHINSGSYLVEIFDLNEDKKVPDGELGRIVVTDYFNRAMPLIRYDTGDLGIMNQSKCKTLGPVLSNVEGRRTDFIFSTSSKMLSPHIITNTMWKYTEIKQFQFIQKGAKQYLLKINTNSHINPTEINQEFKKFLGNDAEIEIESVDEIPLLSSGKRKKVVNEYKIL